MSNKYLEKIAAYTPEMVLKPGVGDAPASQFGRFASYKYPTDGTAVARKFMRSEPDAAAQRLATKRLDVNTRNLQRLHHQVDLRNDTVAAYEQVERENRFNDVLGRHQAKVEGMRAAEEAAASRAKKIGLGLGALGVAGAGAYAVHKHLQEKQAETYSMPLKDAIKEHKDLTAVLRSNNRKDELKELKEQGEELKGMMNRE